MSGWVGLRPKPNSTRLDRFVEFRSRIQSNIRVGSDVLGNQLAGSELSICQVWALDWSEILDIVKIIINSFFWAFLAQITWFDSLINPIDFRFFEFPIYFKLGLFLLNLF